MHVGLLFGPVPTYDGNGRLLSFVLNATFKGQILKLNCLECQLCRKLYNNSALNVLKPFFFVNDVQN